MAWTNCLRQKRGHAILASFLSPTGHIVKFLQTERPLLYNLKSDTRKIVHLGHYSSFSTQGGEKITNWQIVKPWGPHGAVWLHRVKERKKRAGGCGIFLFHKDLFCVIASVFFLSFFLFSRTQAHNILTSKVSQPLWKVLESLSSESFVPRNILLLSLSLPINKEFFPPKEYFIFVTFTFIRNAHSTLPCIVIDRTFWIH